MATQDVECRKSPTAMARSLERLVRRVTTESAEREQTAPRRGNDRRCRRERPTEANDDLERQTVTTKRTGTNVPPPTEQRGRAPNELKLSGGPGEVKRRVQEKAPRR